MNAFYWKLIYILICNTYYILICNKLKKVIFKNAGQLDNIITKFKKLELKTFLTFYHLLRFFFVPFNTYFVNK